MAVLFSNNASTTLSAGVGNSATSITVADGSVFPAISGSDYFYVTLEVDSDSDLKEIVKCTARSGNTLTIVRAQDGTSARTFSTADKCELRLTAAGLNDVATQADTDTTYSIGDGGLTQNNFTDALKTKLDGTEASADVTDTTNVTAAGALMDSEVTNLAQVKAFDSSDYATAAQADQTVSLTGAGTTTISGTYPNFTITGAGTTYTAGTGITLTGTEFQLTDTNAKLNASDYTAADVLTKIKTVDGSGSGLDADTLDGVQASGFISTSVTQPSNIAIRNVSPTVYLRDTDHNSAMLHCNSDIFYVLRGGDDTTTWTQVNGQWPLQINLTNNASTFGGDITAVTGNYSTSASQNTFTTPSGNIQLGPMNSAYAHIYTDRPSFYFNKELKVLGSSVYHSGNSGIAVKGNLDMASDSTTSARYVNLPRGGGITFYGNGSVSHSITSRNSSGTVTDDLFMQSYGGIFLGLDSNNNNSSSADFKIVTNGNSTARLTFSGENYGLTVSGNVTAYSDARLKENVELIPDALEKVRRLRGVTFTRNDHKDTERRHVGVIAQEVEAVLPEAVWDGEDGIKNVAYGNMVGLLIEAVKELKAEVEELKGNA